MIRKTATDSYRPRGALDTVTSRGGLLTSLGARREPGDDEIRRGHVGRERNVVDVAHTEQRADVRIVRLRGERIDEEEHGVDVSRGDLRRDLRVTALGPTEQLLDLEPYF